MFVWLFCFDRSNIRLYSIKSNPAGHEEFVVHEVVHFGALYTRIERHRCPCISFGVENYDVYLGIVAVLYQRIFFSDELRVTKQAEGV